MTVEDRADALVAIWIDLLREWTEVDSDAAPPTTFADDLRAQVESREIPSAGRRRLTAIFDEDRTTGMLPYAVAALQAVAAREYDLKNPHVARWADLYFGMEAWLAERSGGPSPRVLALRLPPEKAAGTIDYLTAWDAARRLLEPLIHDRPYGTGRFETVATLWRQIAELVQDQPDRTQWYWARVNRALIVRDQGLAWELLYDAAYGPGGYGADHGERGDRLGGARGTRCRTA